MVTKQKVAISLTLLVVTLAVGLIWLWVGVGLYPKEVLSEAQLQRRRMIGVALKEMDTDRFFRSLVNKMGESEEVIVAFGCDSCPATYELLNTANETGRPALYLYFIGKPKAVAEGIVAAPVEEIEGISPELKSLVPIWLLVKPRERSVVALANPSTNWRSNYRKLKYEAVLVGGE